MDDKKTETHAQRALGIYQTLRRRVLTVLVVAMFAGLLFVQASYSPESIVLEITHELGVLMIFLGIVGRLWATLYIGGRKSQEVVTGGPYSVTRNPLYVFSAIAAAGVGAQMGSLVAMIVFALLCAGAFHIVILREERFLTDELGPPYRTYVARVPRFVPDLSIYNEGEIASFRPQLLLNTLLDGLIFLVAMPIFELIASAQASGTLPVLLRIP